MCKMLKCPGYPYVPNETNINNYTYFKRQNATNIAMYVCTHTVKAMYVMSIVEVQ